MISWNTARMKSMYSATRVRIQGRVLDQISQQPFGSVRLSFLSSNGTGSRVIAQCLTDRRGHYTVFIDRDEFILTTERAGSPLHIFTAQVAVATLSGEALLTPTEMRFLPNTQNSIVIPRESCEVTDEDWRYVAHRLRERRLARLNEITEALINADPGSNDFADINICTRQQIVLELEESFADPTGQLRSSGISARLHLLADPVSYAAARLRLANDAALLNRLAQAHARATIFRKMAAVDWVVDLDDLALGHLGDAVMKFEDIYSHTLSNYDSNISAIKQYPEFTKTYPPSDLSRYRDYLLAICTGNRPERKSRLEKRLHQAFDGNNTSPMSANKILHGLVKQILMAPMGEFGFGVKASSIPAQGNQSNWDYLELLVARSGLTKEEFGLRYRLNLERSDLALSSVVEEQIATLQAFLTDSFQSQPDPGSQFDSVIPPTLIGRAPFFLFYTEWLRRSGVFHAENYFSPERCVGIRSMPDIDRKQWLSVEGDAIINWDPNTQLLIKLVHAEASITDGYDHFQKLQYDKALEEYSKAEVWLNDAFFRVFYPSPRKVSSGPQMSVNDAIEEITNVITGVLDVELLAPEYMDGFYDTVRPWMAEDDPTTLANDYSVWLNGSRPMMRFYLYHLLLVVLPALRGDAALAHGDFASAVSYYELATRFLLGRANESMPPGWDIDHDIPSAEALGADVRSGLDPLPYTASLTIPRSANSIDAPDPFAQEQQIRHAFTLSFLQVLHPTEERFLKLRHAEAMLEWGDMLYRTNERSSIQRAREVYKAVLFLYGGDVNISPNWHSPFLETIGAPTISFETPWYRQHDVNPAVASHLYRATVALVQIKNGLNYYGLSDDVIPVLRYGVLKEAADRFAAASRSAQQDFLAYLTKVEEAIKEEIIQTNLLRRAELHASIAREQANIAGVGLELANVQVQQIEQAIEAKQREIDESSDFFGQAVDFIKGMVGAIEDVTKKAKGLGIDVSADSIKAGVGINANWTVSESAMASSAATGATVLAGYGMFAYAGYTSMTGLVAQANSLQSQLDQLTEKALPLAERQVGARQSEVNIANLQLQIALSDAQLARDLLHFQSARFLNTKLWVLLSTVVKRLLRRYLALGGRYAWLAERALAFEQNRSLDIVRLDYYPVRLSGLSGADLLQGDLAELEVARLEGLRKSVPIRRTFSLQFDFPVAYSQLRSTGRCMFVTSEAILRREHPGTFGYAVTSVLVSFGGGNGMPPVRGVLTNIGVSTKSREDGSSVLVLRSAESMPISELRYDDSPTMTAPTDALNVFEGSGIETEWILDVPPGANPYGLEGLADVQITFDLRAYHSMALMGADFAAMPKSIRRLVLLSLSASQASEFEALYSGTASVTFQAGLGPNSLPEWHSGSILRNVVVVFVSTPTMSVHFSLSAVNTDKVAAVDAKDGVALSNLPPFVNAGAQLPASPMNIFSGLPATQQFAITINLSENPGVDFSLVTNIVLGIEYEGMLPPVM